MAAQINVLHLEDEEVVVNLIQRLLENAGFNADCKNVQTKQEFLEALENGCWDIVIADYALPEFDGITALKLLRERDKDLPFIFFSGSMGEEKAVESLKIGCTDYVFKHNVASLIPAIERALRDSHERRKQVETQNALQERELILSSISSAAHDSIIMTDCKGKVSFWNEAAEKMFGFSSQEAVKKKIHHLIAPGESRKSFESKFQNIQKSGNGPSAGKVFELIGIHKNKSRFEVEISLSAMHIKEELNVVSIIRDISKRKRDEKIREVVYKIASAGLETENIFQFYSLIQNELSKLIDTNNFFIGFYEAESDTISFPYMQDEKDRFEKVPAANTMSRFVILDNKSLLLRGDEIEEFIDSHNIKRVGTPAKCWLAVPLAADKAAMGIMVVQSYDNPQAFDETDKVLLEFTARQISASIKRKQVDEELARSEQLFRMTLASAGDMIFLTLPDEKVEFMNRQAQVHFEMEDINNTAGLDLSFPFFWCGESIEEVRSAYKKTIESKEKTDLICTCGDFHYELLLTPVIREGEVYRVVCIARDITERLMAEEALRKSEDFLNLTGDMAKVGGWQLNMETKKVKWTRTTCRIHEVPDDYLPELEEAVNFYHPDDREMVKDCIDQALHSCKQYEFEAKLITAKGHHLWVRSFGRPVIENGRCVQLSGTFQDITEQKMLESQLAHAQKLESIGQLAAGIAHEINTPTQYIGDNTHFIKDSFNDINTLLGVFYQMQEAEQDADSLRALLDKAKAIADEIDLGFLLSEIPQAINQSLDGISKVSKIVKAMKEFSHPGAKDKSAVDLNKLISNTITVSRNEWKYTADINTEFDSSLTAVPCFPDEFNQVILNIIINAAHAIEDTLDENRSKGTITIQTSQKEGMAEIRIRDTGTGMPEEVRKKIFDPFFTTKAVGKGTGQGLAISHNVIVNKHNGTIDVESRPGKGTLFIIRLPLEE